MASSGSAWARRLHLKWRADGRKNQAASVAENNVKSLGSLKIGASGPIGTGGDRAQGRDRKPSPSIEREGTICEYMEVMQILLGSSDNALLINASQAICNMTRP